MTDNVQAIRGDLAVEQDLEREVLDHMRSKFAEARAEGHEVTGASFVIHSEDGDGAPSSMTGWYHGSAVAGAYLLAYAGVRLTMASVDPDA